MKGMYVPTVSIIHYLLEYDGSYKLYVLQTLVQKENEKQSEKESGCKKKSITAVK